MNRILAFVLALALVLSLCACGSSTSAKPSSSPTPTANATQKPTPAATPEPVRDQDWLRNITADDLKTHTGEILSVIYNGTDLVVKQKIKSNLTNKLTIDQNYFNACEIIRSLGGAEINDFQYWAVADMQDGSEGKVISFTVPAKIVKTIQTKDFPDNTLVDYVQDLWVLPSLQK